MKAGRIVLLVLGSLLALIGFVLIGGAATLGWATGTQRDDTGYFHTTTERFHSDSYAITSDQIDLGDPGPDQWLSKHHVATVRLRVENSGAGSLFVGIGPEADVERYFAAVPHDEVAQVHFGPFKATYRLDNGDGGGIPAPPAGQTFWVAKATGETTQTLTWDVQPGRWAFVVMNNDGTASVTADIQLGAKIDYLVPIAIGLAIAGVVLLAAGATMIVAGASGEHVAPGSVPAIGDHGLAPRHRYPLVIEGHIDQDLSRWKWLIKWILAIPHFIVLALLWIAFAALTFAAFWVILFTGRYPRRMFVFNVGVLRWTWRVAYYATGPLATDQYPPFTLRPADYPASLDVEYPEHLSRGLVLVKSWLLAIPHLIIVAFFTASWGFNDHRDDGRAVFSGGLLGLLTLVAVIILLVRKHYPRGLYDLLMGLNRWVYRVVAYVALMTDEYPPFHLDQGGLEPSSATLPPPHLPAPPPG